ECARSAAPPAAPRPRAPPATPARWPVRSGPRRPRRASPPPPRGAPPPPRPPPAVPPRSRCAPPAAGSAPPSTRRGSGSRSPRRPPRLPAALEEEEDQDRGDEGDELHEDEERVAGRGVGQRSGAQPQGERHQVQEHHRRALREPQGDQAVGEVPAVAHV